MVVMKTIKVTAAVICHNDKVFAVQRSYGTGKGQWEFPGGKIEPGETPEEALKREIREELETEIEVHESLGIIEYDYPEFHLSMNCFRASILSGTLHPLEASDTRWLDLAHLDSVDWLPADRLILDRVRAILEDSICVH